MGAQCGGLANFSFYKEMPIFQIHEGSKKAAGQNLMAKICRRFHQFMTIRPSHEKTAIGADWRGLSRKKRTSLDAISRRKQPGHRPFLPLQLFIGM